MVHCWELKSEYMAEVYGENSEEYFDALVNEGICLLPAGHEGPHEFVPEDEVGIRFEEDVGKSTRRRER